MTLPKIDMKNSDIKETIWNKKPKNFTIPLLVLDKTICNKTNTLTHTANKLIQQRQMKNKQFG